MNLLDLNKNEIREIIVSLGEKRYRADQLSKWLYSGCHFEQMSNIPQSLIDDLKENGYQEGLPDVIQVVESKDGTKKYLLGLSDGSEIECVLMLNNYGNTLCISSQVGCSMGCLFCASGKYGKSRDLTSGEMLGQYITVNSSMGAGRSIKNIVVMGMGEPFDNYDNLIAFIRSASSADGLGISCRDISVSTCGLPEKIIRFSGENLPVNLCISLHAATDEKRKVIMPVANKHQICDIINAVRKYYDSNHRRIIIEYILIKDFNDSDADIKDLSGLLHDINCHVNVIALNRNDDRFETPTKKQTYSFASKLMRHGVSATVRMSHGSDILGACGQLRNKNYEENMS